MRIAIVVINRVYKVRLIALRRSGGLLALILLLLLSGCGLAEPEVADLAEVKRNFLSLRFLAPYYPETRGLTDRQLFERSCLQKRVKCSALLEILKQEDEKFYQILMKQK